MTLPTSDNHMNCTSRLVYHCINWNSCITCIAAANSDSLIQCTPFKWTTFVSDQSGLCIQLVHNISDQ